MSTRAGDAVGRLSSVLMVTEEQIDGAHKWQSRWMDQQHTILHLRILRSAELQQPRHDGAKQRVAEGSRDEALRPPLSVACFHAVTRRSILRRTIMWPTGTRSMPKTRTLYSTNQQIRHRSYTGDCCHVEQR